MARKFKDGELVSLSRYPTYQMSPAVRQSYFDNTSLKIVRLRSGYGYVVQTPNGEEHNVKTSYLKKFCSTKEVLTKELKEGLISDNEFFNFLTQHSKFPTEVQA